MFVATNPTTINRIAEIDGVSWIEEVPEPSSNSGIPNDLLETGRPHMTPITGRGLRGLDQIVGVLDSGVFPLTIAGSVTTPTLTLGRTTAR